MFYSNTGLTVASSEHCPPMLLRSVLSLQLTPLGEASPYVWNTVKNLPSQSALRVGIPQILG